MNSYFEKESPDSLLFRVALTKIIAVLGPFAKTIQCWESQHTTCADIYLFFLAIVAQLDDLFAKNTIKLEPKTIEAIRAITNKRFNEIINNSPNDPYVTAFFLDPRKLTFHSKKINLTDSTSQNTVMPQYTSK
jgi:hypothetical protein